MTITAARKTTTRSAAPSAAQMFHGQSTEEADRQRDLVTAMFDLLEETHPDVIKPHRDILEADVRHYMKGARGTIMDKPDSETRARRVLALFNGRNAREVARKLGIGKTSVYRYIKQAGKQSK